MSVGVGVWGGGGGAGAPDVPAIPEFMSLPIGLEPDVTFRAAYDDEVISMTKEQLPKGTQFISII